MRNTGLSPQHPRPNDPGDRLRVTRMMFDTTKGLGWQPFNQRCNVSLIACACETSSDVRIPTILVATFAFQANAMLIQ